MPKFIWCGEFYTTNQYKKSRKKASGIVILDATEANKASIDALIFAGYPDKCICKKENKYISLHSEFDNYYYHSNLK